MFSNQVLAALLPLSSHFGEGAQFTNFLISPHYFNLNHPECTKKGWNNYSFCFKKKKTVNADFKWLTSFRFSSWCLTIRLSSIKLCMLSIIMTFTPLGRMALTFKSRESYLLGFQAGQTHIISDPEWQRRELENRHVKSGWLSPNGNKERASRYKAVSLLTCSPGLSHPVLWLINSRKPTKFQKRIAHLYLSFPCVARISNTKWTRSKSRKRWQCQWLENRFSSYY